jgi:hypothetical protein
MDDGSQPASAASACGRSRPWVSEIAPMVRLMPDQTTRGAACAASACYAVIYIGRREFAEAGGLMSYGANIADAWRREINPLHIRRLSDPVAGSCHSAPARANKSWSRYRRPKTERSCIEAYPGKDAQTRQNLTICREKETLRVRIPGLARSRLVESELAARELSVFSSDTDADDWHHRISGQQIIALTMRRPEGLGKGILLLHDIHPATVAALPGLLKALKDNRFRIVQVARPRPT